jgi:hypothetical protein
LLGVRVAMAGAKAATVGDDLRRTMRSITLAARTTINDFIIQRLEPLTEN